MAAYRRPFPTFVVATLVAGLVVTAMPDPAQSTTPTLMWAGAKRVNIMCNVAGGPGIDHLALAKEVCRDVKHEASKGSPLPVETIELGDPAVLAGDSVTLLVQASVTPQKTGLLMALSVRPYRTSTAGAELLFAAPPRAVLVESPAGERPRLNAAIAATLSETLPWLSREGRPQPIDRND